jgi:hypothetical protein
VYKLTDYSVRSDTHLSSPFLDDWWSGLTQQTGYQERKPGTCCYQLPGYRMQLDDRSHCRSAWSSKQIESHTCGQTQVERDTRSAHLLNQSPIFWPRLSTQIIGTWASVVLQYSSQGHNQARLKDVNPTSKLTNQIQWHEGQFQICRFVSPVASSTAKTHQPTAPVTSVQLRLSEIRGVKCWRFSSVSAINTAANFRKNVLGEGGRPLHRHDKGS